MKVKRLRFKYKSDIATHTTADNTITKTTTPSGTKMYSIPSGGPNSSKISVVVDTYVLVLEASNEISVLLGNDVIGLETFHNPFSSVEFIYASDISLDVLIAMVVV